MFHCKDLHDRFFTFSVGQMFKGIFKRSKISEANKEPKNKTKEYDPKCKAFYERKDKSCHTHSYDSDERDDSMRKLENFKVASKDAKVSHDECKSIDD